MNLRSVFIAVGACLVLLAAGVGYSLLPKAPASHAAILLDRSGSVSDRCQCIKSLAGRIFASSGLNAASGLSFFVTGEAAAVQPVLLEKFSIPKTSKVLEGRNRTAQLRERHFNDLLVKCQAVRPSDDSPIWIGINMALQHLRSEGCSGGSECLLFVQTDGKENLDDRITKALNTKARTKLVLPSPVDNAGIKIVFVGLAQTKDRSMSAARNRDAGRMERLQSIWRALFTVPENVSFEPYCDGPD